jgi:predicted  nucleic acid-binding Zn-ribbon protein
MHQCLNCGAVYEDIRELENGCKMCGGRRFYFAESPLDEEARKDIKQKKPSGIAKVMVDDTRLEKWIEARVEPETERRGIIEIKGKGSYEIDIEALLDSKPIIVEKDGSYLIYLPSLFDSLKRGRK